MARSGRLRTLINSKTSYIQDADGNVFHRHPGVSWGLQAVSAPQAVTACRLFSADEPALECFQTLVDRSEEHTSELQSRGPTGRRRLSEKQKELEERQQRHNR